MNMLKVRKIQTLNCFVLCIASWMLIFSVSCKKQTKDTSSDLKLWYDKPASIWEEALPIGNGKLGAMIYGNPALEKIQFNEETFWAGGPDTLSNPGTYKHLPQIRNYIFEGKYKEAHELTNAKIIGPPLMPFLPMGDLMIKMIDHEKYSNYKRQLDLRSAIVSVTYEVDGIIFSREIFATPYDNALIVHLESKGDKNINFEVSFSNEVGAKCEVIDDTTFKLYGHAPERKGKEGKVEFASVLRIRNYEGSNIIQDSSILVKGGKVVDLILTASTNFKSYNDLSINPSKRCELIHNDIDLKSFYEIKRDHIEAHQELFNRVDLLLPKTKNSLLPTDERLEAFRESEDPDLIALYYQFGRYLLISSSRPGSQPANLQGIWNDKINPPWDSKYTTNINLEMNYWAANSANLTECAVPLYNMIKDLSETGRITAKNNWNANGWVLHHNTDIWRSTTPIDGASWGIWPTGGAWLCTHLWEYYQYSMDLNFLKTFYPVMKESARFFVETLVEHPEKGWLVTCPSISPENRILPGNISICAGPSCDNQLIRDLFNQCISAADVLNENQSFSDTLKAILPRLAPDQIGEGGYLQEWMEDWDMKVPEIQHRHISHLYGLFPGNQFTKEKTPDLWEACKKSLEIRGDSGTGWAIAWKINLWARLYDGEHAYKLVKNLLTYTDAQGHGGQGGTYPNLFDACPPFQIDGNLGAVSGINEMLMQSQNNEIHLLPALPKALDTGVIKGIRARGGFVVDIAWKDGALKQVNIFSRRGQKCKVRIGDKVVDFETKAGKNYLLDKDLNTV